MANSVDSDQTAPKEQSDLGLNCSIMHISKTLVYNIFGHSL